VVTLSGSIGYTRNSSSAVALASNATVTDPDSSDFAGGSLVVAITSGGEAANRLTLTGGPFALSGTTLKYNGTAIGILTGNGVGTTALSVQFNGSATVSIVQSLVRNVRFKTVNSASNASRVVSFQVSDGDGSTSNTATKTVVVLG
jgi:hypothetical protein